MFPRLGFDTFTSSEYMPEENNTNPLGWIKDEILTDEILKCLDSSEGPDYIYTVSVQGHGDYPSEPVLEDPVITVTGAPNEIMNYKWEYYVNQMYEMDQFVQELVDALEEYPEDCILVMYGDHLPTMDLTVEDMKNRYLFQTEYVIYNNFGMKKQDENLAAYQMGAEILDRVGIHEGNVIRYHQARKNTKNYQVDLEMIQYDLLYGKKYLYGGESPFERVSMRMGLYDVTLDSIVKGLESEHVYYLHGTNFTPSSQVKLNGDWYDTVYVNPTTLIISGTELDDFDRLSVVQRSNSSTRKALSKSYDRAVYALYSQNKWKFRKRTEHQVMRKWKAVSYIEENTEIYQKNSLEHTKNACGFSAVRKMLPDHPCGRDQREREAPALFWIPCSGCGISCGLFTSPHLVTWINGASSSTAG